MDVRDYVMDETNHSKFITVGSRVSAFFHASISID